MNKQKLNKEQKADNNSVSQPIAKPNVVGSQMSANGRRVTLSWSDDPKNPIDIQDVVTTLYPAKLSNEVMLFG